MRPASVAPLDILAALATSPLRNPYTGRPFEWDGEAGAFTDSSRHARRASSLLLRPRHHGAPLPLRLARALLTCDGGRLHVPAVRGQSRYSTGLTAMLTQPRRSRSAI